MSQPQGQTQSYDGKAAFHPDTQVFSFLYQLKLFTYSKYSLQKSLEKKGTLCYSIGYHTKKDDQTVPADEFSKECRCQKQLRLYSKYGMRKPLQGIYTYSARGSLREDFSSARFAGANQKSARIVDPIRRIFVTISERSSGGKDSVKISCDEFLEVPYNQL